MMLTNLYDVSIAVTPGINSNKTFWYVGSIKLIEQDTDKKGPHQIDISPLNPEPQTIEIKTLLTGKAIQSVVHKSVNYIQIEE